MTGSKHNGERIRFYQCRDLRHHDGRMKHHRAVRLEGQFASTLDRLTADDALLETYARTKSSSAAEETAAFDARLTDLRFELARIDDRRRVIFEALEDSELPRDQLQWRLKDLVRLEADLRAQLDDVERERQVARGRRVQLDDLRRVVLSAKRNWERAPIDDRRALAKALGTAFGGLVVDLDGTLRLGSDGDVPGLEAAAALRELKVRPQ